MINLLYSFIFIALQFLLSSIPLLTIIFLSTFDYLRWSFEAGVLAFTSIKRRFCKKTNHLGIYRFKSNLETAKSKRYLYLSMKTNGFLIDRSLGRVWWEWDYLTRVDSVERLPFTWHVVSRHCKPKKTLIGNPVELRS